MVAKNYNISSSRKDLKDCYLCYLSFLEQYRTHIKRIKLNQYIYDLNDCTVIIRLINQEEINKKHKNNLTIIGKNDNLQKIIQEIKSKKFLLEEIIN